MIKIGSKSFKLFTQGEHAWARTPDDDGGDDRGDEGRGDMTVSGTSTKSTTSLDTYSLLGFTDAFKRDAVMPLQEMTGPRPLAATTAGRA